MSETASSSGINFASMLAIVFITLKLIRVIAWSWWWVLSPLWIPVLFWGAILGFCLIMTAATEYKANRLLGRIRRVK